MEEEMRELTESYLYGLSKVIWDNIGFPSSKYFSPLVAKDFLETMEKKMGLRIQVQDLDKALDEIAKCLVEKVGAAHSIDVNKQERAVEVIVEDCTFRPLVKRLVKEGIPIFVCPLVNLMMAAAERSGLLGEFGPVEVEDSKCKLVFDLYSKETRVHVE